MMQYRHFFPNKKSEQAKNRWGKVRGKMNLSGAAQRLKDRPKLLAVLISAQTFANRVRPCL